MRPKSVLPLSLPITLAAALLPLPLWAEVPRVVTDIPAVQALVAQVMGDLGAPEVLLEQGGNAHSYQMKPSQARALQNADLVIWIGPEMTPWLARAIAGVAGEEAQLELLEAPGTFRRAFGDAAAHDHDAQAAGAAAQAEDGHSAAEHADAGHTEEEHTDEGHADEGHAEDAQAEEGAAHAHSGIDPHVWLDPANAQYWLGLIAAQLAAADPENAATYSANASAAQADIRALDARIAAQLAPVQDKPFVVFHDAYGYFAGHYGLNVAGAIALGDAADPGAAHLTALRADLTAKGVVCAFPEAQHDPKQVAQLIEGTGVRQGGRLDPSGSALDYGPGLYAALLQGLADTLGGCLTTP